MDIQDGAMDHNKSKVAKLDIDVTHSLKKLKAENAVKEQLPIQLETNEPEDEEKPNMPFTKSSPVWKSVESLDVFQNTPQRPHFSPLVKFNEDSREGLAIGHMITFANLVEKAQNLQVSHPQNIIERYLETLKELENHGFEMETVKSRLTELQTLKGKVGQLEDSSKEAEGRIVKLNEEKKEMEELIEKVEMEMKMIKEF